MWQATINVLLGLDLIKGIWAVPTSSIILFQNLSGLYHSPWKSCPSPFPPTRAKCNTSSAFLEPAHLSVIVKNSSPHWQLADCCLSVGRLLVICRPTVGQLSTNTLPTVDRQIYLDFSEKITSCRISVDQQSTDCRLTVGDLSVRCWQSVGNFMPIIALKSVWFTTLDNCIEKIKWNSQ